MTMPPENHKLLLTFCSLLVFGAQVLFLLYFRLLSDDKITRSSVKLDNGNMKNVYYTDDGLTKLVKALAHTRHFDVPRLNNLLLSAGVEGISNKTERTQREFVTDSGQTSKPSVAVPAGNVPQRITESRLAEVKNDMTKTQNISSNPKCHLAPEIFRGREDINYEHHDLSFLENKFKYFQDGGRWRPTNCHATKRIALIIPYRNREHHLKVLLLNLIPKLQRQLVDFTVYIIEQKNGSSFNRGMMRNVGFLEAKKDFRYDCYIFHDVDTIIENDRNIYTCRQGTARHIAVAVNTRGYRNVQCLHSVNVYKQGGLAIRVTAGTLYQRLLYEGSVSGILGLTGTDFEKTNGYSNFFFMWGGEDDSFYTRLTKNGIKITRPPEDVGMVTTIQHQEEPRDPKRYALMSYVEKLDDIDGIKNIQYSNLTIQRRKLFTKISVSVNQTLYDEMLMQYKYGKQMEIKNGKKTENKNGTQTENRKHDDEFTTTTYKNDVLPGNNTQRKDQNTTKTAFKKDQNVKYRNISGKYDKNNTERNFIQKKYRISNKDIQNMINRTGKLWIPTAQNIYKNVFDICQISNHSTGKGSELIDDNFKNETFLNSSTCPICPPNLHGIEKVKDIYPRMEELERRFSDIEPGGHWAPRSCNASKKVAIIMPMRERYLHLRKLLYNLIPKLKRQMIDFTIYIVEQGNDAEFNRGMMRNIGFLQAAKDQKYDCYVFNDVDTLIEDDRNIYTCVKDSVYHMAVYVDRHGYGLLYQSLIGGILSVTEPVFRSVNGFTNFLFSWGGEDDNLYHRLNAKKIPITRPATNVSKTTTFEHSREKIIVLRYLKVRAIWPFTYKDGLNSVKWEKYDVQKRKLFTWVYAKVNETFYDKMLARYILQRKALLRKGLWKTKKTI